MIAKVATGLLVGAAAIAFFRRAMRKVSEDVSREFDDVIVALTLPILSRGQTDDSVLLAQRLRTAIETGSHRLDDFPGVVRVVLELKKLSPSELELAVIVYRDESSGPTLRAMRTVAWSDLPQEFRHSLMKTGQPSLEYPLSVRADS